MKKLYTLVATTSLFASLSTQSIAQCGGNRYHDYIFPTAPTPISDIVYGSNIKTDAFGLGTGSVQSLKLDVYKPVGDVSTNRALVIIAHGGSFISGSKTNGDVVPLAKDLARMGYVTASIEYRLGMKNIFSGLDSTNAGAAVMRGVHDGRAAVRFFRKNARIGGNTYGIDTNQIYFAGVSAGGFIAVHIAYMDELSEFPNYIDTTGTLEVGLGGGIEGVSGNQGYSSDVKAVVNICGALGDTAWMNTGDEPVLSFHGTVDATVPYGHAIIAVSGVQLLKVYGSSTIAAQANNVGIENCMETWLGQDHVPEVASAAYYDSTITITRNFLEHQVCGVALNCNYTTAPMIGINELISTDYISVYPNPAQTNFTIDLSSFAKHNANIELYNGLGQEVKSISNIKSSVYTFNREDLSNGIYFINIISEGKTYSKKIVIE